ncbi:hypothetical protein [Mycobacterium sp.]|nr:hypothetical protein [Mycobacterium sp.]
MYTAIAIVIALAAGLAAGAIVGTFGNAVIALLQKLRAPKPNER